MDSRLPKHAPRMQAVGDVDEANSAIGLAVIAIGDRPEAGWLTTIQNDLFDLGADLATPMPEGGTNPGRCGSSRPRSIGWSSRSMR